MVKWAGTQNKVSVKRKRGDPVSVIFQSMQRLALKARGSKHLVPESRKQNRTSFASQMRTVRSDEAVYSTPLPFNPPPPHRTTFTLAS